MKKRWSKRKISFFVLSFLFIFLCLLYYVKIVDPVIKTYSSAQIRALTEQAANLAVSNVINRSINYDALIDISYNANGEIASFSANQYEINSITREIVKEAQFLMNSLGEDGLPINIGTFTGIPFLLGRGPAINLRLVPIGSVNGTFASEFNSVGINMTRHTLFLYVDVHVSLVMPIKSYDVYTTSQVLLAESIIVGKVPDVYLNGGSLGQSLNLVP